MGISELTAQGQHQLRKRDLLLLPSSQAKTRLQHLLAHRHMQLALSLWRGATNGGYSGYAIGGSSFVCEAVIGAMLTAVGLEGRDECMELALDSHHMHMVCWWPRVGELHVAWCRCCRRGDGEER